MAAKKKKKRVKKETRGRPKRGRRVAVITTHVTPEMKKFCKGLYSGSKFISDLIEKASSKLMKKYQLMGKVRKDLNADRENHVQLTATVSLAAKKKWDRIPAGIRSRFIREAFQKAPNSLFDDHYT